MNKIRKLREDNVHEIAEIWKLFGNPTKDRRKDGPFLLDKQGKKRHLYYPSTNRFGITKSYMDFLIKTYEGEFLIILAIKESKDSDFPKGVYILPYWKIKEEIQDISINWPMGKRKDGTENKPIGYQVTINIDKPIKWAGIEIKIKIDQYYFTISEILTLKKAQKMHERTREEMHERFDTLEKIIEEKIEQAIENQDINLLVEIIIKEQKNLNTIFKRVFRNMEKSDMTVSELKVFFKKFTKALKKSEQLKVLFEPRLREKLLKFCADIAKYFVGDKFASYIVDKIEETIDRNFKI